MQTVLARKKKHGPVHAPRAATTYLTCVNAIPDKDGMWRVFTADGKKRKVHPDTLEDWFRLRCEINWEESEIDSRENISKYIGRRLPTPGNPLVQLGNKWISKRKLGDDNFLKAAFLPTNYADYHKQQLSSLNVDGIRTFLSSLRFSTTALRTLNILRETYLNLTGAITAEQYELDCKTVDVNRIITRQDVKSLCTDAGEYLSDDALDTIANHMLRTSSGIVFMSSLNAKNLLDMQQVPKQLITKLNKMRDRTIKNLKITLDAVHLVVGFLNINGNHWVAYAIDSNLKQILYIDSFGNPPTSYMNILRHIQIAFFGEIAFEQSHNIYRAQKDGWSCGFHALWAMHVFAAQLHRELHPVYFVLCVSKNTIKYARRWVLRTILGIANAAP